MNYVNALICQEPGSLRLVQRPAPQATAEAALVRPRRVGICGTDYHIFEGKHPFLKYPRVMGHELAVEVVQAPPGSRAAQGQICVINPYLACGECLACQAGKSNCCLTLSVLGVHQDGGMTELLSVPARNLVRADGLAADACATVEFLAIGAHAVRRGGVSGRDSVLVIGTGPIGLGVAIFAHLSGAQVTVLDREPERAAAAQSIAGANAILRDGEDWRDFTHGNGFDVVFDATGNRQSMEKSFDYVAHGGRYVLVGVIKDAITFQDPDFHRKEVTLLASRNATAEDFERVITSIRNGRVPVDRLITHRTSLADAVRDIPLWATRKAGLIKALIEID